MDFISLSKILPLLIFPFNLALWLLIVALILLWFRRTTWAGGCLAIAIAILLVGGNPSLSYALYANLERSYPPRPIAEHPNTDAIVVLAGGLGLPLPPRLSMDLRSSADRLLHASRLYHAGKSPLIILSGGNVFSQPGFESESFYALQLLQEWGVPETAIVIEDRSRNTHENAVFTKQVLTQKNIKEVILVTSASHMPRAVATFQTSGIDVVPSPTDYNLVSSSQPGALNWIPSLTAVNWTTNAIREHLGILVYRYKGWIKNEATNQD